MELERRLKLRDPHLSVTWCAGGPHMHRWVILRTDDSGEVAVVKVFRNEQGEYARPEPSVGDNLVLATGSVGAQILKDIEREEARKEAENARLQEEFYEELGDRLATDIQSAAGVKHSILVSTSIEDAKAKAA